MRGEKLLAVLAGDNVVRLLPPLVTTAEEAREGLARLEKAAEAVSKR
jgi:acetylornithine/N-succinyldiaminopimelate aminotransferase